MICVLCKKLLSPIKTQGYKNFSYYALNVATPIDHVLLKSQKLGSLHHLLTRSLRKTATSVKEDDDENESLNSFTSNEPIPNRKPVRETKVASDLFSVSNPSIMNDDSNKVLNEESKPKKAIDLALEVRKERAQQKSPFQVLKNEELNPLKKAIHALSIPCYDKMNDQELAAYVRRNVIYADKRILVFNKPYGISMHDGDKTSRNLKDVLPMVSKMVYGVNTNIPLSICNRLDKFTTGICVTTVDSKTTSMILKLFREHKILRKYWAVTVDVPQPHMGIIDIPLDREVISGEQSYARMVTKADVRYDPTINKEVKHRSRGHTAITNYTTLDSTSLALVELQPLTTIKHQLRVHLADGLDCPILGDHKYSHYGKLAPQILPKRVLSRFKIPQSKSRFMPMHLHLQSILIPNLFPEKKKPHLILSAMLPQHMSKTMKKFGLKPGPLTKWKGIDHIVGSTNDTAEPRNLENKDLYTDPTIEPHTKKEPDIEKDLYEDSYNVYRKNRILVKYKHN